jgi:hypothetical protein
MEKITLCITTHCIKTERQGLYSGVNNIVPSTPSTKLIESVIIDFFNKTSLNPNDVLIHIGFDKRTGRDIDEIYHKNLLLLEQKLGNLKVFVNESVIDDPIVTAPKNFINLIDSVETKLYIFWEHDWIFNKQIDLIPIIDEILRNDKINYIRFNQFDNNNLRYNNLIENGFNPSNNISLIPTFRWSNNPYVCKTSVFKNWWKTFVYNTSNEGGFVEGPINELMEFYITKMGTDLALERFKCFVYGNWNDQAVVAHLNGNSWY